MSLKKRSRRGKIRLTVCMLCAMSLVTYGVLSLFDVIGSKGYMHKDTVASVEEEDKVFITTPEVPVTVVTATPVVAVVPGDASGTGKEPDVLDIQQAALLYVDSSLSDWITEEEDFAKDVIGLSYEKCLKISSMEVSVGDVASYGNGTGVCVGFNDGLPVYAYYSSLQMLEGHGSGGVYLGYSLEDCDSLLYGMLPVPFDTYYDVVSGGGNDMAFSEKMHDVSQGKLDELEVLFDYGRMASRGEGKSLADVVPEEYLLNELRMKLSHNEYVSFVDTFGEKNLACSGEYTFYPKEKKEEEEYTIYNISAVSLNAGSVFEVGQKEWELTVFKEDCGGGMILCPVSVARYYIGMIGLGEAYMYDEESGKDVEIVYGYQKREDGSEEYVTVYGTTDLSGGIPMKYTFDKIYAYAEYQEDGSAYYNAPDGKQYRYSAEEVEAYLSMKGELWRLPQE